jgi:small subunit ribosomal protein S16
VTPFAPHLTRRFAPPSPANAGEGNVFISFLVGLRYNTRFRNPILKGLIQQMVVIRLSRGGAKKRPFYHIVATDKRHRRDGGNCLERLGYFNPIAGAEEPSLNRLNIKRDRVAHFIALGAQPSHRVAALLAEWDKKAS